MKKISTSSKTRMQTIYEFTNSKHNFKVAVEETTRRNYRLNRLEHNKTATTVELDLPICKKANLANEFSGCYIFSNAEIISMTDDSLTISENNEFITTFNFYDQKIEILKSVIEKSSNNESIKPIMETTFSFFSHVFIYAAKVLDSKYSKMLRTNANILPSYSQDNLDLNNLSSVLCTVHKTSYGYIADVSVTIDNVSIPVRNINIEITDNKSEDKNVIEDTTTIKSIVDFKTNSHLPTLVEETKTAYKTSITNNSIVNFKANSYIPTLVRETKTEYKKSINFDNHITESTKIFESDLYNPKPKEYNFIASKIFEYYEKENKKIPTMILERYNRFEELFTRSDFNNGKLVRNVTYSNYDENGDPIFIIGTEFKEDGFVVRTDYTETPYVPIPIYHINEVELEDEAFYNLMVQSYEKETSKNEVRDTTKEDSIS